MKRVLTGNSLPDASHFKNVLEHAGIACVIKNRELGGGIGDLPVFDCAPELWVFDDADVGRAETLIAAAQRPAASGVPWRCSACGEDNEPQFAVCWRCERADRRAAEHG